MPHGLYPGSIQQSRPARQADDAVGRFMRAYEKGNVGGGDAQRARLVLDGVNDRFIIGHDEHTAQALIGGAKLDHTGAGTSLLVGNDLRAPVGSAAVGQRLGAGSPGFQKSLAKHAALAYGLQRFRKTLAQSRK